MVCYLSESGKTHFLSINDKENVFCAAKQRNLNYILEREGWMVFINSCIRTNSSHSWCLSGACGDGARSILCMKKGI